MNSRKPSTIHTARLHLQSILDCDTDSLLDLLTNNEVGKTFMLPEFQSREAALPLSDTLKRLSDLDDRFVYGIYLDRNLIGFINEVEIIGSEIELGLVIHPGQKNRGFATEVLTASIQELFGLGYSAVKTGAFEENTASIRVMEKAGMTRLDQITELEYRGTIHSCIWFEQRNPSN